ncbi:MAG: type II toxin-antitoxin system Phd/YefM family antitoxin [Chloroflexia bacterium]|nr:type II toxin-antitoxin system Phd/YefM family antitoxin [Chloroflexia bacterium]
MAWQLAEAKNKLSEVFTKTIEEGPQFVTRRNEEIVLISKDEYQRLTGEEPGFLDALRSAPDFDELHLERVQLRVRNVDL